MSLKPEQHASIAASYEAAAADLLIPAERRAEFARKAEWFRHLARLEAKREHSGQMPDPSTAPSTSREDKRKIFGMKYLLAALWLTGGVLFLIGTWLFSDAANLAGVEEQARPSSNQISALSKSKQPQPANPDPVTQLDPQRQAIASTAPDRPHAISPDQPASEPPLTASKPPLTTEAPEKAPIAAPPSTAEQPKIAERPKIAEQPKITRKIKSAANIRSAPSMSAEIIGSAAAGADLHVTAYEADWVQFVDPSSGNGGWIHSTSLESDNVGDATIAATDPVEELPQVEVAKPKPAKSAKPRAKSNVATKRQRPIDPAPKAYVELPPDEDFLPIGRRGRPGILERRRMLREGLMSPGFLPPR